jgi:hypothetical protein
MIILKSISFSRHSDLVIFININKIKREDILSLTTTSNNVTSHVLFFYADSEIQEKDKGVFGW